MHSVNIDVCASKVGSPVKTTSDWPFDRNPSENFSSWLRTLPVLTLTCHLDHPYLSIVVYWLSYNRCPFLLVVYWKSLRLCCISHFKMEDSISKKQKVGVLHFEVFLQYNRKYLDNGYTKVYRPELNGRVKINFWVLCPAKMNENGSHASKTLLPGPFRN